MEINNAAKKWYRTLHDFPVGNRLMKSAIDPCLFARTEQDEFLYVLVWVDDILNVGNSNQTVNKLKEKLCHNFKMEDRGKNERFLGLRKTHSKLGKNIDHEHFFEKVLRRLGMEDCEPSKAPVEPYVRKRN